MAALVLYIDGSDIPLDKKKGRRALGWGLIALHDGLHIERAGCYHANAELTGFHELVAFVEGMQYAKQAGFQPDDIAIYTDDETVAYAHLAMHPENYRATAAIRLRHRIGKLSNALYGGKVAEQVVRYLTGARIHKLKGHRTCVYNNRVDYLANGLAQRKPIDDYDAWLAGGILRYRSPTETETWHPPFSGKT